MNDGTFVESVQDDVETGMFVDNEVQVGPDV